MKVLLLLSMLGIITFGSCTSNISVSLYQTGNLTCPGKTTVFVCTTLGTNLIWYYYDGTGYQIIIPYNRDETTGNLTTTYLDNNVTVDVYLARAQSVGNNFAECSSVLEVRSEGHIPDSIEFLCETSGLENLSKNKSGTFNTGVEKYFQDNIQWTFSYLNNNTEECLMKISYPRSNANETVQYTVLYDNNILMEGSISQNSTSSIGFGNCQPVPIGGRVQIRASSICDSTETFVQVSYDDSVCQSMEKQTTPSSEEVPTTPSSEEVPTTPSSEEVPTTSSSEEAPTTPSSMTCGTTKKCTSILNILFILFYLFGVHHNL